MEKAASRLALEALVEAFRLHESAYTAATYNEAQARTDFITPLLGIMGWDVHNGRQLPPTLREVVEEANVQIDDASPTRRPDYELRLARIRKLFVEAKKPSVNLMTDTAPAFQARRYGFSASMPIVVLTSFRQLSIYDSTVAPVVGDGAHVARIATFDYTEFVARFDEMWEFFSRDVVYSGRFDAQYETELSYRGSAPFDELFLSQVRSWRHRLAADIYSHAPGLTATQLTFAAQIFLSRLVFLRICEDRDIEGYEQLRNVAAAGGFEPYKALLQQADDFYDSGLFDVLVDERLETIVSDDVLVAIIAELYYPQSPYTFSVVETEVLGRIYEQFLGEIITVSGGQVIVIERPEVRESGGVVPTPRQVVDEIMDRTVHPLLQGRSPADLVGFTVLDMCCGSGIFLLSAFERLCDYYLGWYLADGAEKHAGRTLMEDARGWRLTFAERRRILLEHVRGVDIDAEAVEVAQLSLLLKLVEGESRADLQSYVSETGSRALPDLSPVIRSGNSLVSRSDWEHVSGPLAPALEATIKPFDWSEEFPVETGRGGFDAIVGNPPYIRIQHMAKYSPEEVAFYHSPLSPYSTADKDNFDKYALFVERGIEILVPDGRQGVITPHKFMSIQSGERLRQLLADRVSEIVHFGSQQVFPGVSNYTAITICGPVSDSPVPVETVADVEAWKRGVHGEVVEYARTDFGSEPWRLASVEFNNLVARLKTEGAQRLTDVADIFVGVQTSRDAVYIVTPIAVTDDYVTIEWDGRQWELERGILRRCLNDVKIRAFTQPEPNRWIVFPYYTGTDDRVHLIQPDAFETTYPNTFEYLSARRDELSGRSISGGIAAEKQWYQYGRTQSLANFGKPKIILPVLSLEPKYAPDDSDVVVTGGGNGPYYLIRSEKPEALPDKVILAILNYPLSEAIVRSNTSVFRGGYYSHGKQFISDILIPQLSGAQVDAVVVLVDQLIEALHARDTALTPAERNAAVRRIAGVGARLWAEIDAAFKITPQERAVITSVPMP